MDAFFFNDEPNFEPIDDSAATPELAEAPSPWQTVDAPPDAYDYDQTLVPDDNEEIAQQMDEVRDFLEASEDLATAIYDMYDLMQFVSHHVDQIQSLGHTSPYGSQFGTTTLDLLKDSVSNASSMVNWSADFITTTWGKYTPHEYPNTVHDPFEFIGLTPAQHQTWIGESRIEAADVIVGELSDVMLKLELAKTVVPDAAGVLKVLGQLIQVKMDQMQSLRDDTEDKLAIAQT